MAEDGQVEVLEDLLTTADLCRGFNRSELTVLLWRRSGSLPYVRIPGDKRDTIRYRLDRVRAWAQRTNRTFNWPVASNG